jgi:hypothetical protein
MTYPSFSSGEVLTAADMNKVGLWLISTVTLSGVTNNINSVFSSTYDNYRVVISGLNNATSTTRSVVLRFRTTSDDTSANYIQTERYIYPINNGADSAASGQTSSKLVGLSNWSGGGAGISLDIYNPNKATATGYVGQSFTYQADVATWVARHLAGGINVSTQFTGFSIIGTTDNLSGTVRVYGYRD